MAGDSAANHIAKWDGNRWSPLGSGVIGAEVDAIATTGREVYVGGLLLTAGGKPSSYLALWHEPLGTSVDAEKQQPTPTSFALHQNYPNPFNPTTTIRYSLPSAQEVTLKIYDLRGREIATLVHARQAAGEHSINFDASRFASGVYFYKLTAGRFSEAKKMLLVR
jgi:hypothetical protein